MPVGKTAGKQKEWDMISVQEVYSQLLASYTEPRHRARLLAASSDHSGDHVLPIAACDLHLDNEAMRVAVGLRLGCVLCESHTCRYGATADTLCTHAFSCKRSSSRILRHNYINDVIRRALTRAGVLSMKEPHGLVVRDDGKRPYGLTLLPWNSGRSATWYVTVVDTLWNVYLQQSAITSASAAETAAIRKRNKYSLLSGTRDFFQRHWKHFDL